MKFVIRHEGFGAFLKSLIWFNVGCRCDWTKDSSLSISFDNQEEAKATLDFIRDVLDFELSSSATTQTSSCSESSKSRTSRMKSKVALASS